MGVLPDVLKQMEDLLGEEKSPKSSEDAEEDEEKEEKEAVLIDKTVAPEGIYLYPLFNLLFAYGPLLTVQIIDSGQFSYFWSVCCPLMCRSRAKNDATCCKLI